MDLTEKYRPSKIEDVVGQDAVVEQLQGFLKNGGLPQVILFFGPPGVGKTTIARALATGPCGCIKPHEKNIADLTGVDTVREIGDQMRLSSLGDSRVYILDEVQSMSKPAQQAMLKLLEGPPPFVYFFLCTTDPDKLLKAVRSRCTKIKLGPISTEDIKKLLKRVVKREKIKTYPDVLDKIADVADGAARDALKYLTAVKGGKDEESQLEAVTLATENADAIELARVLVNPRSTWADCRVVLKKLQGQEVEMIRRVVVGYVTAIALNGGPLTGRCRAIYNEFDEEMIQSGKAAFAQLTFACLEICPPSSNGRGGRPQGRR